MSKLFHMTVREAYEKSLSYDLANELWNFKYPEDKIDKNNREYI